MFTFISKNSVDFGAHTHVFFFINSCQCVSEWTINLSNECTLNKPYEKRGKEAVEYEA